MGDGQSFNPFRDMSVDDLQGYLRDLTDAELIDLLNTVSDDLKRRNHLLPRPDAGTAGRDAVRAVVDVLFPEKPGDA
jgi:Mg/Co/Ni transporter MgtE